MSSQPAHDRRSPAGRARPLSLALLAATLAAGCAGGAAQPPGSAAIGTSPTRAAVPSGGGEPTPAASVATVPPATPATPASPELPDLPAEPPAGTLVANGGVPVPGALGGYTWGDAGSDAPWIVVGPSGAADGAGPWTVTFEPAVPVTDWIVAWAPIRGGAPGPVAGHDEGTGGGVAFAGPGGGGPWTLKLEAHFGGAGRATYFWRLGGR